MWYRTPWRKETVGQPNGAVYLETEMRNCGSNKSAVNSRETIWYLPSKEMKTRRWLRKGGQGGEWDSDIHELRRGDTDKVSSPPLGQAVIAVGLRFQVATLSGTGIIGSRLGATVLPQCGPTMPLSDREAWLWDSAHTHTHPRSHRHRAVCPGNLPGNHLSSFATLRLGHS